MGNLGTNQQPGFLRGCLFLIGCLLIAPVVGLAQSTDRFNLSYEQLADSNQLEASSIATELYHRFLMDEEGSQLLTAGLLFNQVELTDSALAGSDRSRSLRSIVPEFNWMSILNDSYTLIVTVRPGFFGDLSGDLGREFRLEGGFVLTRVVNDRLTLGLGVGRGSNFARDMAVPLLNFLYFPTDRIMIRGVLPVSASIWFIPNQRWEFGFLYRLQGSLFHLEDTNQPGVDQLGFAAANLGAAVRRHLVGNSFLVFEAGATAMRRYEWTGQRGPSFISSEDPALSRDLDPVPYVRVGFQQKL